MHFTDTVIIALAILAHGWQARIPTTPSTIALAIIINAVALVALILAVLR